MARPNVHTSTGGYTRYNRMMPGTADGVWRGADFSTDASLVDQTRLAYSNNMWRDYANENGGCIESFPGFRAMNLSSGELDGEGTLHGMWAYQHDGVDYIMVHKHKSLYAVNPKTGAVVKIMNGILADHDSQTFNFNGFFWIMDGTGYYRVYDISSGAYSSASASAYTPTTYANGLEYEQRNMLTNSFIEKWDIGTIDDHVVDTYGWIYEVSDTVLTIKKISHTRSVLFVPESVIVDGVRYDTIDIAPGAFYENENLRKVCIMSCRNIGAEAFWQCTNIESVVIHRLTGTIGSVAFGACTKLYEFWLGEANSASVSSDAFDYYTPDSINLHTTYKSNDALTSVTHGIKHQNSELIAMHIGDKVLSDYTAEEKAETKVTRGTSITMDQEYIAPVAEEDSGSYRWMISANFVTPFNMGRITVGTQSHHIAVTVLSPSGVLYDKTMLKDAEIGAAYGIDNDVDYATDADYYILDPVAYNNISRVTVSGGQWGGAEQTMKDYDRTSIWYEVIKLNGMADRIRFHMANPHMLDNATIKIYGDAVASTFGTTSFGAYTNANPRYTGSSTAAINNCTVCAVFDQRPFFSGNPNLPNTIFWASRRADTGAIDPAYIGVCNFQNDGTGNNPINALLPTPTILAVFKEKSGENGSVFYHQGNDTGIDFLPRNYPSIQGVPGYDCLGCAYNFLDDYLFVTDMGVEAIDKQTLNLERTIGHRSTTIDRILDQQDRSRCRMTEWQGYLVLLAGEEVYLADSRKTYKGYTGSVEYEWYRLTDIGYYDGQFRVYRKATGSYLGDAMMDGAVLTRVISGSGKVGDILKTSHTDDEVSITDISYGDFSVGDQIITNVPFYAPTMERIIPTKEFTGGHFLPAKEVVDIGGVLYFACDKGGIFVVNTDRRGREVMEYAHGGKTWYTYNNGGYMALKYKPDAYEMVETGDYVRVYTKDGSNYRDAGSIPVYKESNTSWYVLEPPLDPIAPTDISHEYYTYNNRRYITECATRMDDCGNPMASKNTIKNTVIINAKCYGLARFDVLVKTNRDDWEHTDYVSTSNFSLEDMDFGAHSFRLRHDLTIKSREYKKKWVRKQYLFRNRCFQTPFGIYNVGFGYYFNQKVRV